MSEKEVITPTFPFAPFLLTSIEKKGSKWHFVIDSWEGEAVDIDKDNTFTQTFTWTAHKASAEEIAKFLKEEEKDEVDDYLYNGDIAPGHGGQGYERR